ncbi:MAG: CPBP family intramembrane glutamic endopeptidase [Chloroflexota bacterium]
MPWIGLADTRMHNDPQVRMRHAGIRHIIAGLEAALVWYVLTLSTYGLLLWFARSYEAPSYLYHSLLLLFPILLLLTGAWDRQHLGFVKGRRTWGLISAVLVVALAVLIFRLRGGQIAPPALTLGLFNIILLAPLSEELFFRGILQPGLQSRTGRYAGLLLTAVLFTMAHLPKVLCTSLATIGNFPLFFSIGLVFGVIREESRSIWYCLLCHVLYNLATACF